jgi:prepilin-type N-terminal cleavage/methylation domain-containing protein/prepilin-type processing-associated H-X9-DG protein
MAAAAEDAESWNVLHGRSCMGKTREERMQPRGMVRLRGFSLIELLVAIAIIMILMAITFPMIFTAKEAARRRVCMNNLRQIGMAIQMYASDHGGYTPPQPGSPWWALGKSFGDNTYNPCSFTGSERWRDRFGLEYTVADVLMSYVAHEEVFVCPSHAPRPASEDCFGWSYVLVPNCVSIDRGQRDDPYYGDPSHLWLACDVQGQTWGSNHTHRAWAELRYLNVLYLDGHCRGMVRATPGMAGSAYSDDPNLEAWPLPVESIPSTGEPLPHRPHWRAVGWRG